MKKIKKYICNILCFSILFPHPILLSQANQKDPNPQQVVSEKEKRQKQVQTIANQLFNPVTDDTPPKPDPYPITSINEKAIDTLYGANGFNVNATLLKNIKQFYFYLEYVVRLEQAAFLAGLAAQNNIDVFTVLEKDSWGGLISELKKEVGSWQTIKDSIKKNPTPNWQMIQDSIPAQSWKDIPDTSFWKNIPITQDELLNSVVWQKYIQYAITESFVQDRQLLNSILTAEETIFRYIPDIEVAYYNPDFTHLRYVTETLRLNLILTDNIRKRRLQECNAWQQFNPKTENAAIDLPSLYNQTIQFQQTPFYQLVAQSQNFDATIIDAADQKIKIDSKTTTENPLLQQELMCFAMIKNIQARLYSLFDKDSVDASVAVLEKNITKPQPSVLMYTQEDAAFLQDRAEITAELTKVAQQKKPTVKVSSLNAAPKVMVQGFFDDAWGSIKQAGKDIEKVGSDITDAVENGGEALAYEAASIAENGVGGILSAMGFKEGDNLLKASKELQDKANKAFDNAVKDTENTVDDIAKASKDLAKAGAIVVGGSVGFILQDEKLGKDLSGALDSLADLAIDWVADATNTFIAVNAGVIKFAEDTVNLLGTLITDSIIAIKTGDASIYGTDALNSLKTLAGDLVSSILSSVTFVGKFYLDMFKNIIKFTAYFTSLMTDTFIDIAKGVGFIGALWVGRNPTEVAKEWGETLESHRRTINAVMETTLLIGVTVLSGGTALPVLAMTAGPQVFSVLGGYQEDEMKKEQLQYEQKFLQNYQTYVNNNETIMKNQKEAWEQEFKAKVTAEITNQERQLGFYQNFIQQYFDNVEEQTADTLGQYLASELKPNEKGQVYADVGALYGFDTGVYNFNPSQGFALYNKSRDAFSQEIAVSPAVAMKQPIKQFSTTDIPEKLWFIQKETIPLPQVVSEFEVRLQGIYLLNSYHVGLYLGGKPYDTTEILKTKKAPLDPGRLANMLVYRKTDDNAQQQLGLYQHEGAGWISTAINGPEFEKGSWYRMKMQISSTQLTVKVWKEGEKEPAGQTFPIKQIENDTLTEAQQKEKTIWMNKNYPPKTIGIISSGASIEYQIVNPKVDISPLPQVRKKSDYLVEKDREIQARKKLERLKNPQLGDLQLQPAGLTQLLKGQFIYTTNDTQLQDSQNKPLTDYVLLAQLQQGQTLVDNAIGVSPLEGASGIVSLINGNIYNAQGKQLEQFSYYNEIYNSLSDVLQTYEKTHGPLSQTLLDTINSIRTNYYAQFVGPFTFGPITLNATSSENIAQGIYIYQAVSPEAELQEKPGVPVKDKNGNQLYDYFTVIKNNKINAPYSSGASRIESIVTGNAYNRQSAKPIDSGYTRLLNTYQNNYSLPQSLIDAITASQNYYREKVAQEEKEAKDRQILSIKKPTKPGDMSKPSGPHEGPKTDKDKTEPPSGGSTQGSVQQQQQDAGANDFSFGSG